MFLLDINVWLAMVFEAHSHHNAARGWFEETIENSCSFCRLTQAGFLRLATNPAVFGDESLTMNEAWRCYDTLVSDIRVGFSLEPLGLDHLWRRMTSGETYSPKVWNDAYLAAFAVGSGYTLVTFDKGFAALADLNCKLLTQR
jgi:uncharacterized protein